MNPYAMLAQPGHEPPRQFLEELRQWHDEMVLHQRFVRRLGPDGCADDCPHAAARRLWKEARAVLGAAANNLTFLRACAGDASAPQSAPPAPTSSS